MRRTLSERAHLASNDGDDLRSQDDRDEQTLRIAAVVFLVALGTALLMLVAFPVQHVR